MKRALVLQLLLTEVQLQFFHTFEETILATAVPDQVSSFREPSVSVCVEGTVAILEPKQTLIPECFLTLWGTCVHFSS
jgi:hypothetical protein